MSNNIIIFILIAALLLIVLAIGVYLVSKMKESTARKIKNQAYQEELEAIKKEINSSN